jgi:hypothetical protein
MQSYVTKRRGNQILCTVNRSSTRSQYCFSKNVIKWPSKETISIIQDTLQSSLLFGPNTFVPILWQQRTPSSLYFLAYFPYFEKIKVGLYDLHAVCVSVCLCIPPTHFWMPEPILIKLGMYIMAPEPISKAYFINPSHHSVCLYVYPSYRC